MKLCRIGFCGTGKWVKAYHIPMLRKKQERYKITGFFDAFPENAASAATHGEKVYDSLDSLIQDTEVDVIVVATKPVDTHFAVTMQILEAGKAVLLEKPMTHTSAQCDALIAKSKEKKVLFTVNHNLRCSLCLKATQEVISQGLIGDPLYVEISSPRSWYNPEDFSNYAVHMVDQALSLNRSPLREVTATLAHPNEPMNRCGYGDALLRFEKTPHIRISLMPLPKRQIEADNYPFRGYFRFYTAGTKDTFAIADLGHIPNAEELICNRYYYFDNHPVEFTRREFLDNLNKDYYDFFYESWAKGAPLLVTPEDARNAIRCIELMTDSAKNNRCVAASGLLPPTGKGA